MHETIQIHESNTYKLEFRIQLLSLENILRNQKLKTQLTCYFSKIVVFQDKYWECSSTTATMDSANYNLNFVNHKKFPKLQTLAFDREKCMAATFLLLLWLYQTRLYLYVMFYQVEFRSHVDNHWSKVMGKYNIVIFMTHLDGDMVNKKTIIISMCVWHNLKNLHQVKVYPKLQPIGPTF